MTDNPKKSPKADDGGKQVQPRPTSETKSTETRADKSSDNNCVNMWYNWIHWGIVGSVFLGLGSVITASLIVWQGAEWIRKSIDENLVAKLNDERVLRQIAAQIKPSLIFDARESIIADMGAVQYIRPEDIRVTKRTTEGWPERIHVGFTRAVTIPPILTSLYDSAQIKAERAKGLDWEFEISWFVEPLSKDDKDRLYRMEIIL